MIPNQYKVLIVDDELVVRNVLLRKLSASGYHCEEAGNAREAMDKLTKIPADAVILDINMPEKSGIEFLPQIKSMYPDTQVIMATAVSDTDTAIRCMRDGAYDYLVKPFNLDEMVLTVERALEKRRLELENRDYQLHLELKVEEQTVKIRSVFLNAIKALAYALEVKDRYTSGHSQRVSEVSVAIAQKLGLPAEEIEKLRLAGLVHDIGKIGVQERVLNKPGKLTDEEYQKIKGHPEMGEHILAPVIEDASLLKMVKYHHERFDGTGYPDGIIGEQIPLCARILAAADAYDAMTSERPYRQALSVEAARQQIEMNKGTQFDPAVADALLRTLYTKQESGKGESM